MNLILLIGGSLFVTGAACLAIQRQNARRLEAQYVGQPVLQVLGRFSDIEKLAGKPVSESRNSKHAQLRRLVIAITHEGPVVELLGAWTEPTLETCRLPRHTKLTIWREGTALRSVDFAVDGETLVTEGRFTVPDALLTSAPL